MAETKLGALAVAHAQADLSEPLALPEAAELFVVRVKLPETRGMAGTVLALAWLELEPGADAAHVVLRVRKNDAHGRAGWGALRVVGEAMLGGARQLRAVLCTDQVEAGAEAEYAVTAQQLGAVGEGRILSARASVGFAAAPAPAAAGHAPDASGHDAKDPDWERERP